MLTHVSGLRPDVDLAELWTGSDTAITLAIEEVPTSAPGTRFIYSDINFFLLGDIVRRVSGEPLDRFSHDRIFAPLGMTDTAFTPPESSREPDCSDRPEHFRAASFTIRPPDGWEASPAMQGFSALLRTWRPSAG